MTTVRGLLAVGVLAIALAGCTRAGGGPAATPPTATPSPAPSAIAGGSGSAPGPGTGVTSPPGPTGAPGPFEPVPTIVVPKPGRLDVHPVGATGIDPRVDGRHVTVRLTWWSGVEPCSVLDSVGVAAAGQDIRLTILEGSDQRGVACIELAMFKGTIVDLGELGPGTYTITAGGEAPPAVVTVH